MAKVKKKSLFDHVNAVTSQQSPDYWDSISDDDKKSLEIKNAVRFAIDELGIDFSSQSQRENAWTVIANYAPHVALLNQMREEE